MNQLAWAKAFPNLWLSEWNCESRVRDRSLFPFTSDKLVFCVQYDNARPNRRYEVRWVNPLGHPVVAPIPVALDGVSGIQEVPLPGSRDGYPWGSHEIQWLVDGVIVGTREFQVHGGIKHARR